MRFPEIRHSSPNFSATTRNEQLGVLFHHSVMPFEPTIAHLCDPKSEVSYHCLIAPDGTRCTLVADDQIAWHAGASNFLGRSRCNDFLLGLSFAGNTYAAPLSNAQLESAIEWLSDRWVRCNWKLSCMTDHRQVAPGRKDDLNPVEWTRVHDRIATHFSP